MNIKDIAFHDSSLTNFKIDFENNTLLFIFESYNSGDICNIYQLIFYDVVDLNISEIHKIKEAEIFHLEIEDTNKINMEILIFDGFATVDAYIKFTFDTYLLEIIGVVPEIG